MSDINTGFLKVLFNTGDHKHKALNYNAEIISLKKPFRNNKSIMTSESMKTYQKVIDTYLPNQGLNWF